MLKTLLDGGSGNARHRPGLPRSSSGGVRLNRRDSRPGSRTPITGSGPGATADDTVTVSWADFRAWERQLTTCAHPIRLRGRIDALDLATGELAPVYDTAAEHGGVLHVACGNRRETVCPACSAGLQARRPPARPRGPGRRQGHPRDDHRAPVRVRHPDRAVVRPGPRPPDARQDRAALPPPPRRQDPALPARPGHLLPDPARRGRPPARPADVRRLLRLRPPPCCSTPTRATCGAGSSPTCPGTWPASPGSPRRPCSPRSASGSSRWPNTRHAASSTSTP